jgi:hypothetical protein
MAGMVTGESSIKGRRRPAFGCNCAELTLAIVFPSGVLLLWWITRV